jgi:hypothetical protein
MMNISKTLVLALSNISFKHGEAMLPTNHPRQAEGNELADSGAGESDSFAISWYVN